LDQSIDLSPKDSPSAQQVTGSDWMKSHRDVWNRTILKTPEAKEGKDVAPRLA